MIKIGDKELDQVFIGTNSVSDIYMGVKLIWSAIKSCFGKGWWIDNQPWADSEGWKKLG